MKVVYRGFETRGGPPTPTDMHISKAIRILRDAIIWRAQRIAEQPPEVKKNFFARDIAAMERAICSMEKEQKILHAVAHMEAHEKIGLIWARGNDVY